MDTVTIDLLSACDMVIRHCKGSGNTWAFEEGSEAHLALKESITNARLTLGIDNQKTDKDKGKNT
jgi:hypothetical protein